MSDFIPQKPASVKVGGLGPKAQKLQAMREKAEAANAKAAGKPLAAGGSTFNAKKTNGPTKKAAFQRKAT